MSIRTMARVWDQSQHSGSELLMLLALADFADDDGNSYPAVPTLAAKCRMTPRNANHILAALRASGELQVLLNEGPRGTNRYRIVMGAPLKAASPLKPIAPLKEPSPLKAASSLKPTSRTPEVGFLKPLKPTSDEPSLNHQEPPIAASTSKSALQSGDGFVKFWDCYPKKVSKSDAQKAFAKLKADAELVDAILLALASQKQSPDWQKDGGKFVPHPATWLNGKRWEDEIPKTPAAAAGERKPWEGAR
ncbi:hypothetical protein os1_27190 [Comamonadaceae bacterium OS-1]|nr:hypothetical protein os1_27190 [Comamonadaceae bacterium OS-1]